MADVVASVKEGAMEVASGPKELVKGFTSKPLVAASVAISTLILVVVIEMVRPGLILDPIRRGVNAVVGIFKRK